MAGTVLLWILAVVLIVIGIAGLVLPALPGPVLLFLGFVAAAASEDFVHVGTTTLVALGGMAALAYAVDVIAGEEGLHTQMDMLYNAFPDLDLKIVDMVAEGDKVVVRFEAPGTQQGEFAGIPDGPVHAVPGASAALLRRVQTGSRLRP
jgi:hypothetical protein